MSPSGRNSTGGPRRPRSATGADPCCTNSTATRGAAPLTALRGCNRCSTSGPNTVIAFPSSRARSAGGSPSTQPRAHPSPKVFFTYDYQLISAEPVTEGVSYDARVAHHDSRDRATFRSCASPRHAVAGRPQPQVARACAARCAARLHRTVRTLTRCSNYFRTGGFEYTLTPPRLGFDSIDDFLFSTRLGFCGHYASAFVTLDACRGRAGPRGHGLPRR